MADLWSQKSIRTSVMRLPTPFPSRGGNRSIVGMDRLEDDAHFAGKRRQDVSLNYENIDYSRQEVTYGFTTDHQKGR